MQWRIDLFCPNSASFLFSLFSILCSLLYLLYLFNSIWFYFLLNPHYTRQGTMRVFNGMVIYPAPCPIETLPSLCFLCCFVSLFLSPIQPKSYSTYLFYHPIASFLLIQLSSISWMSPPWTQSSPLRRTRLQLATMSTNQWMSRIAN